MSSKKQQNLPGVVQEIPEIEEKGRQLAEVRKQRMELTRREVALAEELIPLMHQHKLTDYENAGVHVKVVTGEEKVKVKVESIAEDDTEAA